MSKSHEAVQLLQLLLVCLLLLSAETFQFGHLVNNHQQYRHVNARLCSQRQERSFAFRGFSKLREKSAISKSLDVATGRDEDDSNREVNNHPLSKTETSPQSNTEVDNDSVGNRTNFLETSDAGLRNTSLRNGLGVYTCVLLLNFVAIIWGSQHSVIKTVIMDQESASSAVFTLARFSLAVLTVVSFTPNVGALFNANGEESTPTSNGETSPLKKSALERKNKWEKEASKIAWRWGAEMGSWMFLGYAFQAIGLAYTSAQRSGFLLYLNVKFVPFFAFVLLQRQISISTWTSAFVAFFGTALLSFDPSTPINVGDLWSIAAAMASAMFILRMENATEQVDDSAALNAAILWTVATMALFWTVGEGAVTSIQKLDASFDFSSLTSVDSALVGTVAREAFSYPITGVVQTFQAHSVAIIYLGVVSTALSNYLQTIAQQGISAERASIIYAMDPVYGAVFANLILGETLGTQGMVGAGLIALAAATNAFLDFGSQPEDVGVESVNPAITQPADQVLLDNAVENKN